MLPNHFFSYKKKDENWKKRCPWISFEGSHTYLNTIFNWDHCSILVDASSYFLWKQAKLAFLKKEAKVCFQRKQAKQPISLVDWSSTHLFSKDCSSCFLWKQAKWPIAIVDWFSTLLVYLTLIWKIKKKPIYQIKQFWPPLPRSTLFCRFL